MRKLLLCTMFAFCGTLLSGGENMVSGPVQEAEFSSSSSLPKQPPLRGVDFWNLDAMHVPASPVRNLMPNPSFRQGMRYYFRMWGGNFYDAPKEHYRFEIVNEGRRKGSNALLIRTEEQVLPGSERTPDMMSTPMPLEPGKNYVLSCYAKSDLAKGATLILCKHVNHLTPAEKKSTFPLTNQWKRYVYRFHIGKKGPDSININGNNKPPYGKIWVTDVQLEQGEEPSEFIAPEKEGLLITSSASNTIDADQKIDAKFRLFGDGVGKLELNLYNFWRKKIWSKTVSMNPERTIQLPFDSLKLGKGSFCLQAKYISDNGKVWYDYYRFSVLEPILNQKSATRHFFGTSLDHRAFNRDKMYKQYARAGFGNYTYGYSDSTQPKQLKPYHFVNQTCMLVGAHTNRIQTNDPEFRKDLNWLARFFKMTKITEDDEKRIERVAYKIAKAMPYEKRWSFANEAECHSPILKAGRYDEWTRAATAAYRGLKRANPEIEFFPETGTSCYIPNRGYEVTEAYIAAGKRNGILWDFIGIHPYGVLDGGRWFSKKYMMDETISHLFDVLKKYNYPESTPVYATESFNLIHQYVPEWSSGGGADTYLKLKASYDFSREEISQAAWAARTYLLCLKFWPRLKMVHIWRNNIWHDITLTMIPLANAVNTLRVLFPDPEFVTDFKPSVGIHVYVYRGKDGKATAAVWSSREEVELHQISGVEFRLSSLPQDVKLIDLMGNEHPIKRNSKGNIVLLLNGAPLFLVSKDEKDLIQALKKSECSISANSCNVTIAPEANGALVAHTENMEKEECNFTVRENTTKIPAYGKKNIEIIKARPISFGKIFRAGLGYHFQYPGLPSISKSLCMIWFYVPYIKDSPDWSKIPSLKIPHRLWGWKAPEKDFSAECQMAWNEKGLYLRVSVKDSYFSVNKSYEEMRKSNATWKLDNTMELYLDYDEKGKTSINTSQEPNYYRYDFAYGNPDGNSGRPFVFRRQEPDMQLMGGTDAPSKKEASEKIPCQFTRTKDGYIYTVELPHRYIMPMKLASGTHAGFSLSLIDFYRKDGKTAERRLCFTESGAPNERMFTWASILLVK